MKNKIVMGIVGAVLTIAIIAFWGSTKPNSSTSNKPIKKSMQKNIKNKTVKKVEAKININPTNSLETKVSSNSVNDLVKNIKAAKGDDKKVLQLIEQFKKENNNNGNVMIVSVPSLKENSQNLTPKQKLEQQQKMQLKIREQLAKQFKKMPEEQRAKLKQSLNSTKSKENMAKGMNDYYKAMNAEQRKEVDPVIMEVLNNLNSIANENSN